MPATPNTAAITLRPSTERGRTLIDWLDSRHTFSFGQYQDDAHMGFRCLRVINDDIIAPAGGFGEHPHRDMEILTWVLKGSLEHRDSLGNGGIITPGTLQYMTAGSGIRHSEFNASKKELVHLLQIWIQPRARNLPANYGQETFDLAKRTNRWCLVASGDGRDGSMQIQQDADMHVTSLSKGKSLTHETAQGRHLFLHVAEGKITLGENTLESGDAAAISDCTSLAIKAEEDSQVLLFDLA